MTTDSVIPKIKPMSATISQSRPNTNSRLQGTPDTQIRKKQDQKEQKQWEQEEKEHQDRKHKLQEQKQQASIYLTDK